MYSVVKNVDITEINYRKKNSDDLLNSETIVVKISIGATTLPDFREANEADLSELLSRYPVRDGRCNVFRISDEWRTRMERFRNSILVDRLTCSISPITGIIAMSIKVALPQTRRNIAFIAKEFLILHCALTIRRISDSRFNADMIIEAIRYPVSSRYKKIVTKERYENVARRVRW